MSKKVATGKQKMNPVLKQIQNQIKSIFMFENQNITY